MEIANQFEAQTHIWNHVFHFINSMSLKCATELGIPDILHNHGRPITLLELVDALPHVDRSKSNAVYRLMRILTHSGFFAAEKISASDEEGYSLTLASHLLVEDHPSSMRALVLSVLDPILTEPWHHLSKWFQSMEDQAPFDTAYGVSFWERKERNPRFSSCFDECMSRDTPMVADVICGDFKRMFEGLETVVDVGGGKGTLARKIADAFPQMQCVVLDVAAVVAGLEGSRNLKYLEEDMFDYIPPTDGILLKWTLHAWCDDKNVHILKNCKEAITRKGKKGKVIIIDIVLNEQTNDHKSVATQLFSDMHMMIVNRGRERKENEWAKLFSDAGFSSYMIYPCLGFRSVIEVYP